MTLIENIRLAITALWANKMRSLLTMLGIIIGISAVITITTIGNSIQETLSSTFEQFGMNSFIIMLTPKISDEGDYQNTEYTIKDEDKITYKMLNGLIDSYPDQFELSLSEGYANAESINYRKENVKTQITGITSGVLKQSKIDIIQGRNISQQDNLEKKHTVVVSDIFVNQYFPENAKPIGEIVSFSIGDSGETQTFTIVGVYEYSESKLVRFKPGTREIDKETLAYVPLNTVYELKNISEMTYDYATIIWNTDFDMNVVENNIKEYFESAYQHNKNWEVYIENEQGTVDTINTVLNVVTIAISVIAAISLIVGGVGVMNIMLVSIVERTKEIGVRKAIGAKNSSIRQQFVVEAVIICLIGGIIGIMIGVLNGILIGKIALFAISNFYPEYKEIISVSIQPSVTAILVSVIFSMLTGIFFGYYPANKAANMNPIDALRYD